MPSPQQELHRARAALGSGDAKAAARICQKLLTGNPRDVEARHLHGRCQAGMGRLRDATAEFRRVLALRVDHFAALVDLGIAETLDGNFADARAALERAHALDPRPAELHFGLGLCHLGFKDHAAAVAAFRAALERNPRFPDAYNNLGVAHDRLGEWATAADCFRRAIAIHPGYADAWLNLGHVSARLEDLPGAAAALQRAAELQPTDPAVHTALGDALSKLGQSERAAAAYARALVNDPRHSPAHLALGRLEAAKGDDDSARRHFQGAAVTAPGDVAMALQTAAELEALGASGDALAVLRAAAVGSVPNADVEDALGALLHRLNRLPEALDHYERALEVDELRTTTHLRCGHVLESMGAFSRAIECYERARSFNADDAQAVGSIASCAFRLCDWDLLDRMLSVLRDLPDGADALQAFLLLASDLEPLAVAQSLQRRARATRWPTPPPSAGMSAEEIARSTVPLRDGAPLRVAYISPDFRVHPVAYAIAGVIERHDRKRVQPIAVSLAALDGSEIGGRLRHAFEEFIDASTLSDRNVVRRLRDRGVDVAVDLAGLTTGSRPAIFAMRAAPLQVNYLGFPGSMGMDFMDCIVADPLVVPPGDEALYAEKVLRLPNSYLPFDDSRSIDAASMDREAAGLPAHGFVFCAFNNGYKITRAMFGIWMSLLREVPGSVLWLRSMGPMTAANLKHAAQTLGIARERLIFAPFEERIEDHLGRLRLADLFLDTLPYNAHTTASEALWAGVPVITCVGRAFAGRVGASVLTAVGLPELICKDLEEYRLMALRIASSAELHAGLRGRLAQARPTSPLFDTQRYARDLETVLREAWGAAGVDAKT